MVFRRPRSNPRSRQHHDPDLGFEPLTEQQPFDDDSVDPGLIAPSGRVSTPWSPPGSNDLDDLPPPPHSPPAAADTAGRASAGGQSAFNLRGTIYGEPTTIGREAWFSGRGWWQVPTRGESNDVRSHMGTVGDVAVAATSLRGHRHRLKGEPNQDSFTLRAVHLDADSDEPRSLLIAAVCDGVGSSEYSAFGARLTAHQITEILAVMVSDPDHDLFSSLHEFSGQIMAKITKAVTDYRRDEFDAPPIDASQMDLKSLQTTLTFAVVPAFVDPQSMTRTVMVGSVGDSPALVLANEQWHPVIADEADDGVWDTSTQGALGAPGFNLTPLELSAGMGLLLASDGVGNFISFKGEPTPIGADLASSWSQPVGIIDFIQAVAFETQSADDDRTAVMIWPGM
jgi:hypothetical protein